ncbi:hypothetical protein BJG93_26400 [Paraburkholderia sprentiae WSM5005]|uniref:Uncharacterized protein n=1 Tax=Paraburkholderia sprentiae WSM5005 TaxID=754502 RepID=A0A1L1PM11_9BURK|nr:hypothetical protein [Paraburkholderia sprentiae]APA88825.1 hypothetical protein BJG93_26400 [Paraburkholderia sprentiae WSM5005]
MEQHIQKSIGSESTDEEVCGLCRVTYSIFASFPAMPSAEVMNVETGDFFPVDVVRSLSSGHDMTEALGTAWACSCRRRPRNRFDQRFTLTDTAGNALLNTYYTARLPSGARVHGMTDSQGRTGRYMTDGAHSIHIYIGHREA